MPVIFTQNEQHELESITGSTVLSTIDGTTNFGYFGLESSIHLFGCGVLFIYSTNRTENIQTVVNEIGFERQRSVKQICKQTHDLYIERREH